MDASLLAAVDTYVSTDSGAGGGSSSIADDALSTLLRSVPVCVSVPDLVREMGEYLTHEDGIIRRRATQLLAIVLERAVADKATESITGRPEVHRVLLAFFGDRLADYPSVHPCMRAIRALLAMCETHPHAHPGAAIQAARSIFEHLHVQAMEQPQRQATYELLEYMLTTPVHAAALAERSISSGTDSAYILDFAVGFVGAMDGEKDPRCLMVALRIARLLLAPSGSSTGTQPASAGFGDHVISYTGELFDVTACYFPITFTPPPNDPFGISKESLVAALRAVFSASTRLAPLVLPLLMEKLSSSVVEAKRDALQTLQIVLPKYGVAAVRDSLTQLATALRREITAAPLDGKAIGADATSDDDQLTPFGPALWTGAAPPGSVGTTAGAIGLNFSGSTDVHTNSGYGLYSPVAIAERAASASSSASLPHTQISIADEALLTLTSVTQLLSRHVQATGSTDEWHSFVTPLLRAALEEVQRAAESMAGRASARILCALAAASHHALSSVLEAAMPVIGAVYDDATVNHRLSVRCSVMALLAGLLHTVDHGIDHPPGQHPLSRHLNRIYDILLDTLLHPLLPAGIAPRTPGTGAASNVVALLTTATQTRCIAAAGLCDIAVRPPSPVLAVEQKFQITDQFTSIFLTDADDIVREACLRALCTMASVRQRFCNAVLIVAVPRLLAVLRDSLSDSAGEPAGMLAPGAPSACEDASSVATAPTLASTEWHAGMHVPGLADFVARALYALGQLCCISNLRVQHVVVPQLLDLAIELEDSDAGPHVAAGSSESGQDSDSASCVATSPTCKRPTYRLRGYADRASNTARIVSAAIIETLGRMVATKAAVSDTAAMNALLVQTADAVKLYSDIVQRGGGSSRLTVSLAGDTISSHHSTASADELGHPSARAAAESCQPGLAGPMPAGMHAGRAGLLRDDASHVSGTTHSDHEHDSNGDRARAPTGAGSVAGGSDAASEPLLLVPSLLYLTLDNIRDAATVGPDVEARLAGISLSGSAPHAAESTPSASPSGLLPSRVRAAVELIFRTVAIRAAPAVQDALREAVARFLLGEAPPTVSVDLGVAPPSKVDLSSPTAAASLQTHAQLSFVPAPWFHPLVDGATPEQWRQLPAFLKVVACSRRGAPVPCFAQVAYGLVHLVFDMQFPQLSSCEDQRQRHHARNSWVRAPIPASAAAELDDPLNTPPHHPEDGASVAQRATALLALSNDADGTSKGSELTPWYSDLQRTAIIAAQTIGVMFNRYTTSGEGRAVFDSVLSGVLRCIIHRSGLGLRALHALLATLPDVPCQRCPVLASLPPHAVSRARERGVVLFVWLCKGLAMRSHPAALACMAALVNVIGGHDIDRCAEVPLDAHIVTLAGRGLGVILADAAPRHPFHKEAGGSAIGLYKQKLFSAVFAQYQTLVHSLRTQAEPSVDDSSTISSTSSALHSPEYGAPEHDDAFRKHTPGPFMTPRSRLTDAAAAQLVPLLLSLCAMATHLPQAVLLSEIDKVLPLVVRALEIITPVDAAALTGGSASAVMRPKLSAEAVGARSAASFVELRDAVAVSALLCLRLLVQHAPGEVATHLHSLVPVLVALARQQPGQPTKPLVRATAIDCLRGFVQLPYHKLHPVRQTVLQGLYPVLDDPKRAVRRRAAACRNDWMTLSANAPVGAGM